MFESSPSCERVIKKLAGASTLQYAEPELSPRKVSLYHDTQTGILNGDPKSAICVQRFDDSHHSAIHITYRSWLRSSSMQEPRDPPSAVFSLISFLMLLSI